MDLYRRWARRQPSGTHLELEVRLDGRTLEDTKVGRRAGARGHCARYKGLGYQST